jgi:hypothetical protein
VLDANGQSLAYVYGRETNGAVTVTAMRASPQPYWRSSVSDNQFCFGINCGIYKPDIVNARSYTICWHGVVSPYVCTSGAKVSW